MTKPQLQEIPPEIVRVPPQKPPILKDTMASNFLVELKPEVLDISTPQVPTPESDKIASITPFGLAISAFQKSQQSQKELAEMQSKLVFKAIYQREPTPEELAKVPMVAFDVGVIQPIKNLKNIYVGITNATEKLPEIKSLLGSAGKLEQSNNFIQANNIYNQVLSKGEPLMKGLFSDIPEINVDIQRTKGNFFNTTEPTFSTKVTTPPQYINKVISRFSELADSGFKQSNVHFSQVLTSLPAGGKLGVEDKLGFVLEPNLDLIFNRPITDQEYHILSNELQKTGLAGSTLYPDKQGINLYNISKLKNYEQFIEESKKLEGIIQGLTKNGEGFYPTSIQTTFRKLLNVGESDFGATRSYSDIRSQFYSQSEKQAVTQPFTGFSDLTTKFLDYAKGKTTLSKQEILDFARRPELKKGEADLLLRKLKEFEPIKSSSFGDTVKIPQRIKQNQESIESLKNQLKTTSHKDSDILAEIQDEIVQYEDWNKKAGDFYQKQNIKFPAQEFADSIRRDLLELKPVKVQSPQYGNINIEREVPNYQQYGMDADAMAKAKLKGRNYEEVVFESPITTNGSSHYPNSKNYFAHKRRSQKLYGAGWRSEKPQSVQKDIPQKLALGLTGHHATLAQIKPFEKCAQ